LFQGGALVVLHAVARSTLVLHFTVVQDTESIAQVFGIGE
jgi:hypothetical protein